MTVTTKRALVAIVVLALLFVGLSRDSRVIAAEIKAGDADWGKTLEAARKEGKVGVFFYHAGAEQPGAGEQAFERDH